MAQQFAGHWYSGRAARLFLVEAALVGVALFIAGRDATSVREVALLVGTAACVPAAMYLFDLYDPQIMRSDRTRGSRALRALGFAAIAGAFLALFAGTKIARGAFLDMMGVATLGVLLVRAALVVRPGGEGTSRVLLIGSGAQAREISRIIRSEAYGEHDLVATLDPAPVALAEPARAVAQTGTMRDLEDSGGGGPVADVVPLVPSSSSGSTIERGPLADVVPIAAPATASPSAVPSLAVAALVRQKRIDTVVIATDDRRARPLSAQATAAESARTEGKSTLVEELIKLRLSGVTVLPAHRFAVRALRRVPLVFLRPSDLAYGEGLTSPGSAFAKRAFDLIVSSALLLCALPVLGLLAVLIKLDSKGPVLYSQERVGRGGKPYKIHKLRTMKQDAEAQSGPVWASQKDPRVTRMGGFLRKTRLDEIPQVLAVFRGDMSFVGPRPERPYFVQQLKEKIPFFGLREAVKPGITGWAQIRYPYGATIEDARAKLEYDLYYVEHRSLFLDLAIVFHTVKTVLFGRGAR